MKKKAHLYIRSTPGGFLANPGESFVNQIRGGPETLLRWLETQLGLHFLAGHRASRITEYAAALDSVSDSMICKSMANDRWETAAALLSMRDELIVSGWNETDSEQLPEIARDLAKAADGCTFTFVGEGDRLGRVLDALSDGQVLPPHRCSLFDEVQTWPVLWRSVLEQLNHTKHEANLPHAPEGTALHVAQMVAMGNDCPAFNLDNTFRSVRTRSQAASVEFVTAVLAESPQTIATTVICCDDDDLAVRLDACLSRVGLPTTGASTRSKAHPVLQVLPLSLALCWEPVDPQSLLDFLKLPVLPIQRRAASLLAESLTQEPGLGSRSWDAAIKGLCTLEKDPKGILREQLDKWVLSSKTARSDKIASRDVRARCGMVSRWATGRATLIKKDENPDIEMINVLHAVSGQAALLGELAESQGTDLSAPQLSRLIEEALAGGIVTTPYPDVVGSPVRVRSLAEIDGPCDRLIWLGLSALDVSGCRWSTSQIRDLQSQGIEIDDGSKSLSSLRLAEVRGICYVKEAFLAVQLPQDIEKRSHPLWIAISGNLEERDRESPPVFEDVVAAEDGASLTPFAFKCHETEIAPPQQLRPLWNIRSDLILERKSVSATSLQDRLGCPLKWTLNYQAKLRHSPIATLPDEFQLKGTFSHSVLEHVFKDSGKLLTSDEAVSRVASVFDERLPLDAAPLAQPSQYVERERLRRELINSSRVLVDVLASGGYSIVGLELELSGEVFGKELGGWIDCVAVRENGDEAIIDFKYGGRNKYQTLIEDGRAVQLATYAYGRKSVDGKFPAVAYLVLADGLLYTPSGSPIQSNSNSKAIDGPAIQDVWSSFSKAISGAEDWLVSDILVPARPLQEPSDWPDGVLLVLDDKVKRGKQQGICTYCGYQRLCGLKETS